MAAGCRRFRQRARASPEDSHRQLAEGQEAEALGHVEPPLLVAGLRGILDSGVDVPVGGEFYIFYLISGNVWVEYMELN